MIPDPDRSTVTIRLVKFVSVSGFKRRFGLNVPNRTFTGGPFCVSVVCATLLLKVVRAGPRIPVKFETGVVITTMPSARASEGVTAKIVTIANVMSPSLTIELKFCVTLV